MVTTRDEALWQGLKKSRVLAGATPGALEAFLAVRGARTLALRFRRAQDNAQVLAPWLEAHPRVSRVRYPGLPSHPTYAIAKRLLKGFGTMISFDVRGGAEAADMVCRSVRLIRHATSLGAVESTMERRAGIPGQEHLPASLLRFSVGIEDVDDIKADLDAALGIAAR
jgi:cystathionine gamma-synthase